MNVRIVEGVEGARAAAGAVVIIDVLRAFTTAAYACAAGIEEIELVATVEEALARPGFRMGEVGGRLIPGFDHNNSPSGLAGRRLGGRAVMRTGKGTQCAVAAARAESLWLGSLVIAGATVRALRGEPEVTLVVSGAPEEGEEDRAAAEWIAGLLGAAPPLAPEEVVARVRASRAAAKHAAGDPDRPLADLDCCTAIDAFDFALRVDLRDGRRIAVPLRPAAPQPITLAGDGAGAGAGAALPPAHPPMSPTPPASPARTQFGKYELVKELGRGGMGVVYLAWRPDLRAFFAVKILLAGADAAGDALARFEREAQAAARLRHPGIVAVHDLGVEAGKAYYAMEYVEGIGLDAVARGRAPRGLAVHDAARITQEVAEAIAFAHAQGVLHRDLKPANVLLDRDGRARVVDFGLAKLLDPPPGGTRAAGSTRTGVVLGTLSYMAPEKAEGDAGKVDVRSDVYSLGAMLYELVTGRLPFSGATEAAVLMKVLFEEPERPCALNRDLPADLETIIDKAMAKEPARRYPGAAELAADLGRFRAGAAISARPSTLAYRAEKWVRRRRGLVAAVAALALAAGGVAFATWRAGSAEAEKARLRVKVLAHLRAQARLLVDATLTLRRSGVAMAQAQDDYLPRLRQAVEDAEREDPGRAEPSYHLGRMSRALMRFDEALALQDRALAREPGFAPSLYERALLRARAYAERVVALRDDWVREEGQRLAGAGALARGGGLAGAGLRRPPADEELVAQDPQARGLREALAADVERLGRMTAAAAPAPAAGPVVTPALVASAQGLALAYTSRAAGDARRARDLLTQALAADATLEEAYEGVAHLELGAGDLRGAIATYTRGLAADGGYVPHLFGRGKAWSMIGDDERMRGGEPGESYARAQADFTRALELDPRRADTWFARGTVAMNWACFEMTRGREAEAHFRAAETDLRKAVEVDARSVDARMGLGSVRLNWGLLRTRRGEDPTEVFTQAGGDLDRAVALAPESAPAWMRRGMLLSHWLLYRSGRGENPTDLFAAAERACTKALELRPTAEQAWLARGILRLNWGGHRTARGEDPEEVLAGGEADLRKALDCDPRGAEAWMARGAICVCLAQSRAARGVDPGDLDARARKFLEKSLELNPGLPLTWVRLADLDRGQAQQEVDRGGDPRATFERSATEYGKAIELNAATLEAWLGRGQLYLGWGNLEADRGRDPADPCGRAEADFGKVVELSPRAADGWYWRASVRTLWGNFLMGAGGDPEDLFRKAEADCGRAVELAPESVDCWTRRGILHAKWGIWRQGGGADPGELLARAVEELGRALELAPKHSKAHLERGLLLHHLGRWAEAAADLEAAVGLSPRHARECGQELADARRRAAAGPAASPARPEPAWLAKVKRGDLAMRAGNYAAGGRAYAEGLEAYRAAVAALPEAERAGLLAEPDWRFALENAHYNLACVLALASVGKVGPTAAARAVAVEEAARWRAEALGHLEEAVRLGWREREQTGQDADLEPLHGEARWRAVLEAMR